MVIVWTLAAFFLGSLPFSVWIGRRTSGEDIRSTGDKNPGATNVLRSSGFLPFSLALFLDISKGALPVGLAYYVFGLQDWRIVPIALAPTLGHAFSPFLNWRGGKAIAATLGVWIGLTIWVVPLVGTLLLIVWSLLIRPSGWAVLITLVGVLVFIIFWNPQPEFLLVIGGQIVLLFWKHRQDLRQRPTLRISGKQGSR